MNDVSEAVALYGTDEPVAEPATLSAGPVTAELAGGALKHVRYQGTEVIQGIAYLLRDAGWGTPSAEITRQEVQEQRGGFVVTYEARARMSGTTFDYRAEITGARDGAIRFHVVGAPADDMETNRTGFVVLHPLEGVVGRPVEVTHTDGQVETSRFPRLISPGQPIFDVRSLAHEVVPGVRAICTMEGDAFEMEDHRNWMDASYKTYVRPLSKPRPFTLPAGEEVVQTVCLDFRGTPSAPVQRREGPATVRIGDVDGTMPRIGLWVPPDQAEASVAALDRLKPLHPALLIGQLDLRDQATASALVHLATFAQALGAPVMLEIVLANRRPPADELADAAAAVRMAGLAPEAVHASPHEYLKSYQPVGPWPDVPPLEDIYDAARAAFPGVLIGGGMLSYFTELNRRRPPAERIDFVSHATCPIVHDCDDDTVMDNLNALPWIAESVRAIAPGVPYRVGPSMLGMRHNPYGAAPADNPENRRCAMATNDPRQQGLFGAAWNLGYVAHLARAGADAVTLSAPVGAHGILYEKRSYPQPGFDRRGRGVYPLYHVLKGLAEAAGHERLEVEVSDGRSVQAIAWRVGGETLLWLANLTPERIGVSVEGTGAAEGDVTRLDLERFAEATEGPDGFERARGYEALDRLELGPYAVARVVIRG